MSMDLDRRHALAMLIGVAGMVLTSGRTQAATDTPACAPAGSAPVTHDVEINGFAFLPATLAVHPGDKIRWTNADLASHTATALDGSWDTGEIKQGESVEIEVTDAMAVTYRCNFHSTMLAKLTLCSE